MLERAPPYVELSKEGMLVKRPFDSIVYIWLPSNVTVEKVSVNASVSTCGETIMNDKSILRLSDCGTG